ncbi:MAG: hypothetical protein WD972_03275, partial [Candidatus Andersenbacteria bacterium]
MKRLPLLLFGLSLILAPFWVGAQELSPTPLADVSVTLSDEDLETAAAGETLPVDGMAYRWERFRFG